MIEITAAHWVYLVGIVAILATMLTRKNIIVPAVFFTMLVGIVYTGSFPAGLAAIFNATLVAAKELFNIFLIIALVTGMLGALQALGSDKRMVAPFRPIMRNGHLSFWTIAVATYLISLFFWPTPAVPLIGAVLVPVAVRSGLRPLAAGFAIAVAGQGMALSSDYVIRVAPGLSAAAAGADPEVIANRGLALSLITGGVALTIGYVLEFRRMRRPDPALLAAWEGKVDQIEDFMHVDSPSTGRGEALDEMARAAQAREHELVNPDSNDFDTPEGVSPFVSKLFAIAVPLAYLGLIAYLIYTLSSGGEDGGVAGGDAAALVGGIAAMTIFFAAFAESRKTFLERSAEHVVDGLVFAFKAMGVVLPIAGFFFIGNGDFSGTILGVAPNADGVVQGPSLLFDAVLAGQHYIPENGYVSALGILAVGIIAGLDGSGFSGLPLTGSLAGGLAPVVGVSPETLAAVGQMGNIWSGGGTFVAWSSLIAVAGFARVNVLELARMCFLPVMTGLIISTVLAVAIFG